MVNRKDIIVNSTHSIFFSQQICIEDAVVPLREAASNASRHVAALQIQGAFARDLTPTALTALILVSGSLNCDVAGQEGYHGRRLMGINMNVPQTNTGMGLEI